MVVETGKTETKNYSVDQDKIWQILFVLDSDIASPILGEAKPESDQINDAVCSLALKKQNFYLYLKKMQPWYLRQN